MLNYNLKSIISLIIIVTIITTFYCISNASFEEEINSIENEIVSQEQKINIEDEIDKEADPIIQEKSVNNYKNIRGKGLHLLGTYQGLTYYSQADSRWANYPYTSTGNTSQTMKSSGCGPTSAAMVVSSSKGAILPTTMANLFVDNGFRTPNNGTAWSAFPFIADYFEFNSYEYTTNLNTAIEYLRKGYFIIVSCANGLFTTNGHYIVLVRNK